MTSSVKKIRFEDDDNLLNDIKRSMGVVKKGQKQELTIKETHEFKQTMNSMKKLQGYSNELKELEKLNKLSIKQFNIVKKFQPTLKRVENSKSMPQILILKPRPQFNVKLAKTQRNFRIKTEIKRDHKTPHIENRGRYLNIVTDLGSTVPPRGKSELVTIQSNPFTALDQLS